jgi:ABC-type glycerol-3-phosphate transport system permease component
MSALAFLTRTRGKRSLDWTDWLSYVYLTLGLFLMFGPVLWLVMSSFKTEAALTEFPPSFLPYGPKQVKVPGEDNPKPVYRVKLADGSVRELAELRRIGLIATHVDPAKPDSTSACTSGIRCSSPSSRRSSRCFSTRWRRSRCRSTSSRVARRCSS